MIGPIKTVAVCVSDQGAARAFYTEKLGFVVRKALPMTPQAKWLEVGLASAETALVLYPRNLMKNWQELKPSIVFACDDAEATAAELEAKGVRIIDPPVKMQWGTYAKFADSDGNEFLLAGSPD